MFEKNILCSSCGKKYATNETIFRCKRCKGSLEIVFDYNKLKKKVKPSTLKKRRFNHLRYRELFPVKKPLTLGEGGTDLLRSKNIEKELGFRFKLYFKNETENPTGSFKDRGSSIEVARALETKAKKVVCASTGNMGASVSAYSEPTNLDCFIFIPGDASKTKIEQILAYGAKVFQIKGNYTQAAQLAEQSFNKGKAYLLGDYLYRREGTKSVGFEIAEQLPGVDYVFCPIGNGTLISAAWKAFNEFKAMGLIRTRPRMIGIQATGCSPVHKAWKSGKKIKPVRGETIAVAMECGDPLDGDRALKSVKQSRGFTESVSDKDILKAKNLLAKREGLFAEPAGAASLAGLIKSRNKIPRNSHVVCLVTGHGLKTPFTGIKGKPRNIGTNPDIISRIFH